LLKRIKNIIHFMLIYSGIHCLINSYEASKQLADSLVANGTSAATLGFYASVGMQRESTKTKESQSSTTGVGSNFNADSIIIDAGGDATIQGSFLAKDTLSLSGNNITIKAIESKSNYYKSSSSNSQSISASTSGSVSVGGSYGFSNEYGNETKYQNANISAGVLQMNAKNDILLDGVVAVVDYNNIKAGNDIKIASKQDVSSHHSNSAGVNASVSVAGFKKQEAPASNTTSSGNGGGVSDATSGGANNSTSPSKYTFDKSVSGYGGGFNVGSSQGNSAKVKQQSVLLSKNGGIIEAGNKFSNEGAVVGSGYIVDNKIVLNEGADKKMIIKAKEIENITIKDVSYEHRSGFGVQMGFGVNNAKDEAQENAKNLAGGLAGGNASNGAGGNNGGGGNNSTAGGNSLSGNNGAGGNLNGSNSSGSGSWLNNLSSMQVSVQNIKQSTTQDVYASYGNVELQADSIVGEYNVDMDNLRSEEKTYVSSNLNVNLDIPTQLLTKEGRDKLVSQLGTQIQPIMDAVDKINKVYQDYKENKNLTAEQQAVVDKKYEEVNNSIANEIEELIDFDGDNYSGPQGFELTDEDKAEVLRVQYLIANERAEIVSENLIKFLKAVEGDNTDVSKDGKIRIYDDANRKKHIFYDEEKKIYVDSKGNKYIPIGYITVGYGHKITDSDKANPEIMKKYSAGISREDADALFNKDVFTEDRVKSLKNRKDDIYKKHGYDLTQHQKDAIFSAIYNSSGTTFANNPLWSAILKDPYDYDTIESKWKKYAITSEVLNKETKLKERVVVNGLVKRRPLEFKMYQCAEYKTKDGYLIKSSTICSNT
jgi:GH24 family phage-related lysozyme (muramidase)